MSRIAGKRRVRPQTPLWRETEDGIAAYRVSRAAAQEIANRTGFDIGIECNDLFKTWNTFTLPMRQNRMGHELSCEVVSCEILDRCQPGHGPRGVV